MLELRLENGEYMPGELQGFERLGGLEELVQRIIMKLRVRRGSFLPLPNYGSRLHTLATVKPSLREGAARQFVLEALSEEKGLVLEDLKLVPTEGENAELRLRFTYNKAGFEVNTKI